MAQARETGTDVVGIMKDGKVRVNDRIAPPEGPIEVGSVTKSVVGPAIGLQVEETPWGSRWRTSIRNGGRLAKRGSQHLLSPASGPHNGPNMSAEINGCPGFVQLAFRPRSLQVGAWISAAVRMRRERAGDRDLNVRMAAQILPWLGPPPGHPCEGMYRLPPLRGWMGADP